MCAAFPKENKTVCNLVYIVFVPENFRVVYNYLSAAPHIHILVNPSRH